jgi:ribosome-binding protein aMBF1 (putative translation factor)
MTVRFRNVDASPTDDVTTWPYEALVAAIERGLVDDWRPIFAEVRRQPWGSVARRVEQVAGSTDDAPTGRLFTLAVQRARADTEAADRAEVAARIRAAVAASGLTASEFALMVGTSASRLSTYTNGRVVPSAAMLVRIERLGGVTARR